MASATDTLDAVCQPAAGTVSKIALDTCCVRYYLDDVEPWSDCLDRVFRAGLAGNVQLYVSTVVVSELLAHLIRQPRQVAGYDPDLHLTALLTRHFQVLDVSESVARAAGRLQGNAALLQTPDALIGATSVQHNHTLFVTNDARLAAALPVGKCIYLRDVALEWLAERFPRNCLTSERAVPQGRTGPGLPGNPTLATLELGSVRPAPAARWHCILTDAFKVAAALGQPCLFLVLTERIGRKIEAREVLFWHDGLAKTRPLKRLLGRVHDHLGLDPGTGRAANPKKAAVVFCFSSLDRERTWQTQPGFASKTDHQREAEAWDAYLKPLWTFRNALRLPQTTWILCEDGKARRLDAGLTVALLDHAKNVLGWKDG